MTITLLGPDGLAITAQQFRQASAARNGGGAGRPLGGRSGFRIGTPSNILTATSTTWTLGPVAAELDPGATTAQGMYGWASDNNVTGSVTAANATVARKDIVYIQVSDSTAGDGSGAVSAPVLYLAGPEDGTVAAPTLPVRSFLVGYITVPAAGGGSPTVVLNTARFASAGAPLPVASQAERDALQAFKGLQVMRTDVECRIQTWSGTEWFGGERAEFTGNYGVTPATLWGAGPLTKVTAQSLLDAALTSPSNDTVNMQAGQWDIHWRARMTNGSTGTVSSTGTTWMSLQDGSGNEITSFDIVTGNASGSLNVSGLYMPTGGQLKFKYYTVTSGVTLASAIRITRH